MLAETLLQGEEVVVWKSLLLMGRVLFGCSVLFFGWHRTLRGGEMGPNSYRLSMVCMDEEAKKNWLFALTPLIGHPLPLK